MAAGSRLGDLFLSGFRACRWWVLTLRPRANNHANGFARKQNVRERVVALYIFDIAFEKCIPDTYN